LRFCCNAISKRYAIELMPARRVRPDDAALARSAQAVTSDCLLSFQLVMNVARMMFMCR